MIYKEALKLKVGDKVTARWWTGVHTIKKIEIFEEQKHIRLWTDHGVLGHKEVRSLVKKT